MGAKYDIELDQGATFRKTFHWLQGGGETLFDGWPMELYGYTGRCQIRNGVQHPGIIITVPVEIVDEAKGIFALNLTAEQTAAIPATGSNCMETEKYDYDIELVSSGGEVHRLLNGKVLVSPETTR